MFECTCDFQWAMWPEYPERFFPIRPVPMNLKANLNLSSSPLLLSTHERSFKFMGRITDKCYRLIVLCIHVSKFWFTPTRNAIDYTHIILLGFDHIAEVRTIAARTNYGTKRMNIRFPDSWKKDQQSPIVCCFVEIIMMVLAPLYKSIHPHCYTIMWIDL